MPARPPPPPLPPAAPPPARGAGEPPPAARPCLNCGTPVARAYCPDCGQEYEGAAQITLSGAFGDFVGEFVRVEFASREFLRSVRSLLTRPGFLTAEYLAGRRAPYYSPGALFILLNGVFFLAAQYFHAAGVDVGDRPGLSVERVAQARGMTPEAFAGPFASALATVEPTVFFVTVPLFTLVVLLLYRRTGTFAAHAIFALHTLSFFLVMNVLNAPLAAFEGPWTDVASVLLLLVVPALYIVLALRRVYARPWPVTLGKGALAFVGLFVVSLVWDYVSIWLALWRA
jgi:hypothetical protein